MKTKYSEKSGFTLIELMVTIAASAVLALTAALMLMLAFESWKVNNAYVYLQRNMALAVQMLARDVHESVYADMTTGPGQLILPPDAVRPDSVAYARSADGDLVRYVNASESVVIFPAGVLLFDPVLTNGGVLVRLQAEVPEAEVTVTNETFIYARN